MFNPTDVLDRDLYYKTPIFNDFLEKYAATYGKNCTFYINPNHEASENIENSDINASNTDANQRFDNYTLAYGKDLVGYDFAKLQKVDAVLFAEYKDYFVQNVNAEESTSFHIQVRNTPVSRGDIVSYIIQDKEVFYRIVDKVQAFQEILYRINCKLIQVKNLGGGKRPYDVHEHKADVRIIPNGGVVL